MPQSLSIKYPIPSSMIYFNRLMPQSLNIIKYDTLLWTSSMVHYNRLRPQRLNIKYHNIIGHRLLNIQDFTTTTISIFLILLSI